MKTLLPQHSLAGLCVLAAAMTALPQLQAQIPSQGGAPGIRQPGGIRIQSPLLAIPTESDAKSKTTEQEARQAAEVQKPNMPSSDAPKSKEVIQKNAPVENAATTDAANAKPAAEGGGSPGLMPAANVSKPLPLTPEEMDLQPLPPQAESGDGASGLLDPNAVFVPKLKGILLFMDDRKSVDGKPSVVPTSSPAGITLGDGLTTPNSEALTDSLREKYLGKGLSFKILDEIVKDILSHYSKEQRPTTHVYVPEQEITSTIKIAILEGRLGEVKYAGEEDGGRKWYQLHKAANPPVPRALEAQRGEILDMGILTDSLSDLNVSPWARLGRQDAHPYRQASLGLMPGADLGMTDVELSMQSRGIVPVQAFAGWDNTGTVVLGENRFNVGAVWYDAFNTGFNHQLGVQFQSAENYDLFHAVIGSYQIPVKSLNSLIQLYGAYMESSVNIPAAGVAQFIEGDAWILGGRWFYNLPNWLITQSAKSAQDKSRELALYHEIGFGFDYKNQSNNLFFGGVNVFPTQIEVAQYVLDYNLRQTDKWGETTLNLSYFYSPGSITRHNNDAAFLTARSEGTADYSYLRGSLARMLDLGSITKQLDDFKFTVRGTGQWSSENLVASEQIGLGGQDSVRGYPERTMRGDRGILIQTELYSPALHPLRWLAKKTPDRWTDAADRTDELRFLIFYDYGWADVVNPTAAEPGQGLNASSLGLGLRYRFNKSVVFRFDYGFRLEKLDPNLVNVFDMTPKYSHKGDGYAHMGLSVSF